MKGWSAAGLGPWGAGRLITESGQLGWEAACWKGHLAAAGASQKRLSGTAPPGPCMACTLASNPAACSTVRPGAWGLAVLVGQHATWAA